MGTLFRKARNVYCEQEEATWGQGASLDRGWGKGIQVGSQLPPLGSTDIHYLVPAARTFLISHLTWGLGRWAICALGRGHILHENLTPSPICSEPYLLPFSFLCAMLAVSSTALLFHFFFLISVYICSHCRKLPVCSFPPPALTPFLFPSLQQL